MPSNCEIDERSDVWSLGCTLYAMAYGKFVLDSNGGRVSFIYYDIRLVIRLLQFLMVDLESILVFFFKSSAGQVYLNDILARTNLGLHGQKCGIIMVDKITSNLNMHLRFSLHFRQKLRILTLARTLCYLDCGNPIYSGLYLPR